MKPLRILFGNNTLSLLAGSETWTRTLALKLKEIGHDVKCFSPELGIIAERLEQKEIKCFKEISGSGVKPFSFVLEEEENFDFDIIIANHNKIVSYLRSQFPKTPIISTIHGIIHFLEDGKSMAPEHPALDAGVNQFVAVSEEVQQKLKNDYNIDSEIIRNFIDLEEFKESRPIYDKPRQFLINTNYNLANDPEVLVIKEVAKHFGAKLAAVGMNFAPSVDLTKIINESDVVFGIGRSILEPMAMGRICVVHGRWGTAGVVNAGNVDDIKRFNFSGRNSGGKLATKEELIADLERFYNQKTADWGKSYIAANHNAAFAAEKFIAIARELTGEKINEAQPSELRPYRRANENP